MSIELPKEVKIGDRNVTVKERKKLVWKDKEFLGLYFHDNQEILLRSKFKEESSKAKTFLHEVIHGINSHFDFLSSVEDLDQEEKVTTIMANGLSMVFKDNPKLVEYLYKVYCH